MGRALQSLTVIAVAVMSASSSIKSCPGNIKLGARNTTNCYKDVHVNIWFGPGSLNGMEYMVYNVQCNILCQFQKLVYNQTEIKITHQQKIMHI